MIRVAPTKSLAQILRKFLCKGPEGIGMLPWRVMGKKLFWSRDRLDKHEFDCFIGLGLGLGL